MARLEGYKSSTALREWSWSYSKLKNYETCPRKHYEVDIAKNFAEATDDDPNSPLNWGNRLHDVFAKTLKGEIELPAQMAQYQHWIDRVKRGPGILLVEQKFAITRDFQKTSWFSNDAWVRMIGDVVRIDNPFTARDGNSYHLALVLDWKTGRSFDDRVQLMLMAQALFSHYPSLTHVRSEFVWLKDGSTSPELFTREEVADMWVDLMTRVNKLNKAHVDQNYPPKPSGLCKKWCPVQSCPFWKKGA